jgi:hypothetical protein
MSIRDAARAWWTVIGRIGAAPSQVAPVGLTVQRSTTTTRTVIWLVLNNPEAVGGFGAPVAELARTRAEASAGSMAHPSPQKINVTYTVSK